MMIHEHNAIPVSVLLEDLYFVKNGTLPSKAKMIGLLVYFEDLELRAALSEAHRRRST